MARRKYTIIERNYTIEKLGSQGEGIAEGVYIPYTLPGEEVFANVLKDKGRLLNVIKPAANRVEPPCPYFGKCGGCMLQHMSQESYIDFKVELIRRTLKLDFNPPFLMVPHGIRRRAAFSFKNNEMGFHFYQSHKILPFKSCLLLQPILNELFPKFTTIKGEGTLWLTVVDNGIDINIRRKGDPDLHESELVAAVARDYPEVIRITWNNTDMILKAVPEIYGKPFPPSAFLQTSKEAEKMIGSAVHDGLIGCKNVADLFCGLGTYARYLPEATVDGYDIYKGRDLFTHPVPAEELEKYDGIVFNPPRAGAKNQVHEIAKTNVKKVVAVSCNPATLARDLEILYAGGYKLRALICVDQFIYTSYVECIAHLELERE